ncbi:MAG: type II toxin-antitoxin system RelE/ParE family toxin [Planctomycetales bacterium]|nr:type II toxin-antitoxin system RelE/ParE family toxin [Planctomycetales bacterium]NIM08580.1 type II toxin-antitoxin system RelE/ParE family toxin [Planctomycetales bacterium]NIN08049.1 type II toxin-antitoxin system RelE/ParE family toxin [Planctomycetales bacterium]NIN77185.1 type II toxin-antitoxin system RelE/ParE family toxin [Planctomycetales bacterium]NIO34367.1 type II toxin-antitoxin system RelE/ParE family toxin [Planctomycetales bacterium]
MRVTWHPDAENELIEDAKFYDRRAAGLGSDFLDAVDTAVEQILRDPKRFPIIEGNFQRCRVKQFPYCVYFRCLPDTIRILVIKHHSRHSGFFKSRKSTCWTEASPQLEYRLQAE